MHGLSKILSSKTFRYGRKCVLLPIWGLCTHIHRPTRPNYHYQRLINKPLSLPILRTTVEPLLMATPDEWPTLSIMTTHLAWSQLHWNSTYKTSDLRPPLYIIIMAKIFGPNGGHYRGVPYTVYNRAIVIIPISIFYQFPKKVLNIGNQLWVVN